MSTSKVTTFPVGWDSELGYAIRFVSPSLLRKLLYRMVLVPPHLAPTISHVQASFLHRIAELVPKIRGLEPTTCDKVLHTKGVCIGCRRILSFPDGTLWPILPACIKCHDGYSSLIGDIPTSNWRHIRDWSKEYQIECIEVLCGIINKEKEND